jgi:hypothetical protein
VPSKAKRISAHFFNLASANKMVDSLKADFQYFYKTSFVFEVVF